MAPAQPYKATRLRPSNLDPYGVTLTLCTVGQAASVGQGVGGPGLVGILVFPNLLGLAGQR